MRRRWTLVANMATQPMILEMPLLYAESLAPNLSISSLPRKRKRTKFCAINVSTNVPTLPKV